MPLVGSLRLDAGEDGLLLSWAPGAGGPAQAGALYEITPTPVSDIFSIHKHVPRLGWHYVVVLLRSGVAFPPLYFGDGGVRSFLRALGERVPLHPAEDNANVVLVGHCGGDQQLQESLSVLGLPEALADTAVDGVPQPRVAARSDADGAWALEASEVGSFEVLQADGADCAEGGPLGGVDGRGDADAGEAAAAAAAPPPPPPLGLSEWEAMLDPSGRLTDIDALRDRAFKGGIAAEVRAMAWPLLLGLHSPDDTAEELHAARAGRRREYLALRGQWQSVSPAQESRWSGFRDMKHRIDKDVPRTDRRHPLFKADNSEYSKMMKRILMSYLMYNFDLGYCQGMSDLLSPLIVVLAGSECLVGEGDEGTDDIESETFWCFDRLMQIVGSNFDADQTGMHVKLRHLSNMLQVLDPALHDHLANADCLNFFFAFRWVLCLFKRELRYGDVLRFWDALWSGPRDDFVLFCCVAVLRWHKRDIISNGLDFDEMLKLVQGIAGSIDVSKLLVDASALCFSERAAEIALPVLPPRLER
eukprot:PRCOL_00001840-RA